MIKFLRGKKSNLESSQTVYAEGQPICESDTGQLKIGDGTSTYTNLKYVGQPSGGVALGAPLFIHTWDRNHNSWYSTTIDSKYNYILLIYSQPFNNSYYSPTSYFIPIDWFSGASNNVFKIDQTYSNGSSAGQDIWLQLIVSRGDTGISISGGCAANHLSVNEDALKLYAI